MPLGSNINQMGYHNYWEMPQSLQSVANAFVLCTMLFLHTGAAPVQTRVALELMLDVPLIVTDVSKFVISGKLTNTGPRTINVVKDPSGPLFGGFASNAYRFKKTGGKLETPEFVGMVAKWTLESYLKQPGRSKTTGLDGEPLNTTGFGAGAKNDDSGYTEQTSIDGDSAKYDNPFPKAIHELRSEESLIFKSNIGDAYNFTEAGPGKYEVELRRKTFFVLIDGDVQEINVDVRPSIVNIDGKLAGSPSDDVPRFGKREVTTKGCNAVESVVIERAAERADKYVEDSIDYMNGAPEEVERYTVWFGAWSTNDTSPFRYKARDQVWSIYKGLPSFKAPASEGYTYKCSCPKDLNIYAFTTRSITLRRPVIHLCPVFFTNTVRYEGRHSKAGILIQQATQFRFNEKSIPVHMVVGGRVESYYLSQHWPHFAAVNADNYEYFAENVALNEREVFAYEDLKEKEGQRLNSDFYRDFRFAFGR